MSKEGENMKKFRNLFLVLILALTVLCAGLIACNTGSSTKNLTFNMNGHGEQVATQVLGVDDLPETPQVPTAKGWKFDGWYIDADFSEYYYFDEPLSQNTTIYAKWIKMNTVTFNTGVSDCVIEDKEVEPGSLLSLPLQEEMVAKGKKFEGWYLDSSCTSKFNAQTTAITNDITLYAKWNPYYVVTFDNNGRGSASRVPQPQTYEVDGQKAVRPEDMSANSYKFVGWSLEEDGTNKLYDFNTVLTESITLYAQWVRLYNVTFNLNNDEALQDAPDKQSVEEGKTAERPEIDPIILGYAFKGWYTEPVDGKEFDFNTKAITNNVTVYAQWTKTAVGTLEVGPLPEYSHNGEVAFGERPDLDGFIIDGKMGEAENWEDQNWYSVTETDAPSVQMKLTTRISEKGVYLFISVEDNGGLYMSGQNWYFKNSNVLFRITDGKVVNEYRMDTLTLYPSYNTIKIAVNIAEGKVNTANTDNKRAVMNVEAYATWEDLHFEKALDTVKIFSVYNYKRIASDNIKYMLTNTFANPSAVTDADYVEFDKDGYVNADAENAVLGSSSMGVAKTLGWDISHESDEKDAYVSSSGASMQAIFYKNIVNTNYYSFAFDIDASALLGIGKAGAIVYNKATNYAMFVFDINSDTYDYTTKQFKLAKPILYVTDKNGKISGKRLPSVDVSATGKISMEFIFSNGYLYCVLNGTLIQCEFISDLNVRTNPGLCTIEGGAGVRFTNYSARAMTEAEARVETAKHAYVITTGRLNNLTMSLSTTGVSSKPEADKTIVFDIKNAQVSINASQKDMILNENVIDERIRIYQISKLIFTVNGEEHDVTNVIDNATTGLKYGEFTYDYPFSGDAVITNETECIPTEQLTIIKGRLIDEHTGSLVSAMATISSDNSRLSKYDMSVTNGEIVLIVPKGFNYKITFVQNGYRNKVIELGKVDDVYTIEQDVRMTPNILGGTATSLKTGETYTSNLMGWDMSRETDGEIVFETNGANPSAVYFSGYTVSEYQYLKLSVSNVTDTLANPNYEQDPSIGFSFVTPTRKGYIGLRAQGLRFRPHLDFWNPQDDNGYGQNTCNHIDVSGEHKDTLEVIRIRRTLYAYINGKYMGSYVLCEEFDGECAVAVSGTFSYYSKIIYRDYEIKVGNEALAIAKERVGINYTLADNMFEISTETWQVDRTKPYVDIGFIDIEQEDGSVEKALFAGSEIKFSLTENADLRRIYIIKIGTLGSVTLSSQNPTATFKLPSTVSVNVEFSLNSAAASTVTGKFVSDDSSIVGPFTGYLELENGSKLYFTTGEDGTYTVSVPAQTTFKVVLDSQTYIAPDTTSRSPATGQTKTVDDILVYVPTLGGKISGVTGFTSSDYGYKVFYDNSDETIYDGEGVEVNAIGSHFVAINRGKFENFDVSFSLVRYSYDDRNNETDPGFGLLVEGDSEGRETMYFHANGIRAYQKGMPLNQIHGLMSYDTRSSFNVPVDFRIVKRGVVYLMYYKLESHTDWQLIHVQQSSLSGTAGLFIGSSNTYNNHYVFWNVKSKELTDEDVVEFEAEVNVNLTSDPAYGSATLSGGVEVGGEQKYAIGDNLALELKPATGCLLAYVKVNGNRIENIVGTKVSIPVSDYNVDVEVMFEPQFETRMVTGTIAVDGYNSKCKLPSAVNIVAYMEDGRTYSFDNVQVASDGKVSFTLRDGTFKLYAYSQTLSSKAIDFTSSATNSDFGTIVLDVMRSGTATVNGIELNNEASPNESLLFSDGMTIMPMRKQTTLWLTEGVVKGNFVAQTTMIQSKDPNDPWYTTDEVVGFQLSNGTSTLAIMFLESGFRVHARGYSPTEEMVLMRESKEHYFGNKVNASTDTINTLGLQRVGKDLIVYANGVKFMTINSTDGLIMHVAGSSKYNAESNIAHLKACALAILDNTDQEIAIGYRCNINMGNTTTFFNQTGFYNTIISDSASVVDSYNGNITK